MKVGLKNFRRHFTNIQNVPKMLVSVFTVLFRSENKLGYLKKKIK